MGVVPYYFKNNKLYTSRLHGLYVVLLMASGLILCDFNYITMESQLEVKQTAKTSEKILMGVSTTQILAMLTSSMGQKKYLQLSTTMLKCDFAFKQIMHIPYKPIKIQIYIYATPLILVIAITSMATFFFMEDDSGHQYIANNIIFGYVWILDGCVCILAIIHTGAIKQSFGVLNECLGRMQKNNTWAKFKYEQFLKYKIWKPNVEDLARIGSLHLELCGCIKEFNNAFGVILIAHYVMSFVTVLMGVYFGYISYLQSKLAYTFSSTIVAIAYAASLTALCQNCSSTINEVTMFLKFSYFFF